MDKFKIAIFASGSGSNAEEIMKYFQHNTTIQVALLLSNNPQAYAIERAHKFNIRSYVFTKIQFRESDEVISQLKKQGITHVVLAGFLWLIPDNLLKNYSNKIINIHPSLLPKFGGKGMYGMKVHEAVKANAETETGITIHEVNEHYDEGKILFQANCQIENTDAANDIATKVHRLEHAHYAKEIERWILVG